MVLSSHSYYSLRYGVLSPIQLLDTAQKMGWKKLFLTDINSSTAAMEMFRLAPKFNVSIGLGVDFREGVERFYLGLAKNNNGFYRLNSFLSGNLQTGGHWPREAPDLEDVAWVYPFGRVPQRRLNTNEYIGIQVSDLVRFARDNKKQDLSRYVILHTATFRNKRDFNVHRLLRAIGENVLLSKLPVDRQAPAIDLFIPAAGLLEKFVHYPPLIEQTRKLMDDCNCSFDFQKGVAQNQQMFLDDADSDIALLRQLVKEGLLYRYPNPSPKVFDRIEMELSIIIQKGFVSYFLINWDMLKYARSKGYFYVGRGSGANSVVAYILRITDVDPIDLDLYFERFINLYRQNPPDFDVDFSWRDREDITQYLFSKYKNIALLATYNTFQYRALVRELGKVFGLPKAEMDMLSRGNFSFSALDELKQLVLKYGRYLDGLPNYLSVHSGGILISEKPLDCYVASFLPPKGFPTVQFDMHIAEDIGLCKFDILSQRGLGKIKEAVDIVAYNHPHIPPLDIHDIRRFKTDEKIKYLLRNAKAIGCFYVESPAMRMLLRKLKVDDYLGLVAASSVIRPGVAQSGMMREYILRFRDPEKRKEAHPVLLALMPETYGVMVYQEDVIKVAHYFGGLTLGEADMLRRGMSGKFRSREEFQKVKEQFFANCEAAGHPSDFTAEVWRQIESFAGYSFAKGHSASYAVESYQSLFLKAYFPCEYMVAALNNGGGYYRSWVYIHEAKMHGAIVLAPCINKSFSHTVIEGKTIYLGFSFLQSFESETARLIIAERQRNGRFTDFVDFIERVSISLEQVTILIRIDAFRFSKRPKRELLWLAHLNLGGVQHKRTIKKVKKPVELAEGTVVSDDFVYQEPYTPDLFKIPRRDYVLPRFENTWQEDAFDQIEFLGFSLYNAFDLLEHPVDVFFKAVDLSYSVGKEVVLVANLVAVKKTTTAHKQMMCFGTFYDLDGEWVDTVHFPPVVIRFPFSGRGVYKIKGKVEEEFGVHTITVSWMEKLPMIKDPRYTE